MVVLSPCMRSISLCWGVQLVMEEACQQLIRRLNGIVSHSELSSNLSFCVSVKVLQSVTYWVPLIGFNNTSV